MNNMFNLRLSPEELLEQILETRLKGIGDFNISSIRQPAFEAAKSSASGKDGQNSNETGGTAKNISGAANLIGSSGIVGKRGPARGILTGAGSGAALGTSIGGSPIGTGVGTDAGALLGLIGSGKEGGERPPMQQMDTRMGGWYGR